MMNFKRCHICGAVYFSCQKTEGKPTCAECIWRERERQEAERGERQVAKSREAMFAAFADDVEAVRGRE
jgi:hypothetical protein